MVKIHMVTFYTVQNLYGNKVYTVILYAVTFPKKITREQNL